jgi:hypothetical protein
MVAANVLQRTFLIGYKSSIGSCFAIDHLGRQYIVTARHVLEQLSDGEQVKIGYKGSFVTADARLVGEGRMI